MGRQFAVECIHQFELTFALVLFLVEQVEHLLQFEVDALARFVDSIFQALLIFLLRQIAIAGDDQFEHIDVIIAYRA